MLRSKKCGAVARDVGLRMVQLHGSESPEVCAELARDFEIIKALRIDGGFDAQRASAYPMCTILLDTYDEEMAGGTGNVGDSGTCANDKEVCEPADSRGRIESGKCGASHRDGESGWG